MDVFLELLLIYLSLEVHVTKLLGEVLHSRFLFHSRISILSLSPGNIVTGKHERTRATPGFLRSSVVVMPDADGAVIS